MATKKTEQSRNKELARVLYLSGQTQEQILEKVDVCRQTLSRWINQGGWKEERTARTITRPQLVNKALTAMGTMLDKVNNADSENIDNGFCDKLIKTATAVEKLGKQNNPVIKVEVVIELEQWTIDNRELYPELDNDTLKLFNRIHADYISRQFGQEGGNP